MAGLRAEAAMGKPKRRAPSEPSSDGEPCSSDGGSDPSDFPFPVEACTSEERGDGLAAARDLAEGELVLRVAPLVAVPKDSHLLSVCGTCFRRPASGNPPPPPAGAAAAADPGGDLGLQPCASCSSVAHCARCRSSGLARSRHSSDECAALRELMAVMQAAQRSQQQPAAGQAQGGGAAGRRQRRAPGAQRAQRAVAAPAAPVGEAPMRGRGDGAQDSGGTTTLRLVLAVGCYAARARAEERRRRLTQRRRPAAGPRRAAEGSGGGGGGTGEGEGEDGSGSGSASGSSDAWYGSSDVVQDGLADLEQLHGEPEDMAPEELERFVEACRVMKAVQPATARTALDTWLRWAVKVHLNEHDVCVPVVGAAAGGGAEGGEVGAPAAAAAEAAGPSGSGKAVAAAGGGASKGRARGRSADASGSKAQPPQSSPPAAGGGAAAASLALSHVTAVGEGLFPTIARFNHSCAPNVRLRYDEWGCIEARVCATGGVHQGRELCAAYVNPEAPRSVRRAFLRQRYGFDCACERCGKGL